MNSAAEGWDLLVGIVTFNRKDKLISTLERCRELGFRHVVVVDNGSTDGTREYLSKQSEVAVILSQDNGGGSGGFNRIMRHFLQVGRYQWLLTLDDDAYPSFQHRELMCFLGHEASPAPAYALKVTYPDGKLCEMNRPGKNVLAQHPLVSIHGEFHIHEDSRECLVDFASFVGLLISRRTVEQVGLVSKSFFIYSDDTYYTLSISSRIGRIRYSPEFVMVHDCKRSSRRLLNHDPVRLERDVINKIVLIREYSEFPILYICLYVARLLVRNPKLSIHIVRSACKGMSANLQLYRNERLS